MQDFEQQVATTQPDQQQELEQSFPPETARYMGWASLVYIQAPSSRFLLNTLLGLLGTLFVCFLLTLFVGLDVSVDSSGEIESTTGSREAVSYSAGMIAEILKVTGEKVKKGEPLAILEDDGASSESLKQNLRNIDDILKDVESTAQSTKITSLALSTDGLTDSKLLTQIAEVEHSYNDWARKKSFVQKGMQQELGPLLLQEQKLSEKLSIMKSSDSQSDLKYLIDKTEESLGQIQNSIIKVKNASSSGVEDARQNLVRSLRVAQGAIELSYRNKSVLAPIDGMVARIHKGPHSYVASQTVVATIVPSNSDLVGSLQVNSRDIGKIKQGQQVYYKVEAYPYEQYGVFEGKIISHDLIKSDADNFMIRASIQIPARYQDHPELVEMIAGMKFNARIIIKRRSVFLHIVDSIFDPIREYL